MKPFMTAEDWVSSYAKGLLESLRTSFPNNMEGHIEDLSVWTATYSDSVYSFVSNLPRNYKVEKEDEAEPRTNTISPDIELGVAALELGVLRERERIIALLEDHLSGAPELDIPSIRNIVSMIREEK